ncbi:MAG: hypothetical protein AAGF11_00825 [Myxococcota bacterium]
MIRPPTGRWLWLASLGGLVACGSVDGTIFTEVTRTSSGEGTDGAVHSSTVGGTTNGSVDAESSAGGESGNCPETNLADPLVLEGNDPRFTHECGESCDTDWCGCEPCLAVAGPLERLPAGAYRLTINGGASGMIDYLVAVRLESGEILAQESVAYDGLFVDELEFTVSSECPLVEVEWTQQTALCSRVYEVVIERL